MDVTCVIFIFTCVTGVRVSLSVLRLQIALCRLLKVESVRHGWNNNARKTKLLGENLAQ